MLDFGAELRAARKAAGVTQARLAKAIGVTPAAVANWERKPDDPSHRNPARENVIAAAQYLETGNQKLNAWLSHFHFEAVPDEWLEPLRKRRRTLAEIQEECEAYPWPCLAMNDDFEVVAWNLAANLLSELDFGTDLVEPGSRHLLRMALSERYNKKLTNWPDVISIMMGMYKNGGHDLLAPDTQTAYQQRLVAFVAEHHGTELFKLVQLWTTTEPHIEGSRIWFVAKWCTEDGTRLLFNCQLTSWSDFDGTGALDWHPADAQTWTWLGAQRAAASGGMGSRLADFSAGELLRFCRGRLGLTQVDLAERVATAGGQVSAGLIAAIERGKRPLSRKSALALARALDLDTTLLNAMLDASGRTPEPSPQSAYLLGYPVETSSPKYSKLVGGRKHWTPAEMAAEIDRYPWPVILVDGVCEVLASNDTCRRVIGLDVRDTPAGPSRNLVTLVTDRWFRDAVENWEGVVANIFPRDLEIYASPPGKRPPTKDDSYFSEVVRHVRERDAQSGRAHEAIERLFNVWRANRPNRQAARVSFTMRWKGSPAPLSFNAVVTPWNAMIDPCWAIDLHPADADTWEFLEALRE